MCVVDRVTKKLNVRAYRFYATIVRLSAVVIGDIKSYSTPKNTVELATATASRPRRGKLIISSRNRNVRSRSSAYLNIIITRSDYLCTSYAYTVHAPRWWLSGAPR